MYKFKIRVGKKLKAPVRWGVIGTDLLEGCVVYELKAPVRWGVIKWDGLFR